MGLTRQRAERHVAEWSERLLASPRNAQWPAQLFHAAHVTTAAQILRSGYLSCRSGLSFIDHDVANQGALHNNPKAQDFARLYFRPKNNFHLKTEGIKCRDDPYRDRQHMSVPVMLVFDAVSVLTLPSTRFSKGKLSIVRHMGDGDRFFDRISMERVYHDSVPNDEERDSIQDARMAEVVVPGRLPLAPHLHSVICRTPLERRTLLHLLGEDAETFRHRIKVEPVRSSVFLHYGLYLTRADLSTSGLRLDFHPPTKGRLPATLKVRLTNHFPGQPPDHYDLEIPSEPNVTIRTIPATPENCWEIEIEDVLAFYAPIPWQTSVLR